MGDGTPAVTNQRTNSSRDENSESKKDSTAAVSSEQLEADEPQKTDGGAMSSASPVSPISAASNGTL